MLNHLYACLTFAAEDRAAFFKLKNDPNVPAKYRAVYYQRWEAAKAEADAIRARIRAAEAVAADPR
jgi:hypothetical protein